MSNCFPSSPNWYLSHCCDLSEKDDIFCYGSKNNLVFLQVQTNAKEDENIFRYLRTIEAHGERVTGVSLLSTTSVLYCVTSSDDGKCRVWSAESYSLTSEFEVSELVEEEEKKIFKATAVDTSSVGGNAQVVVANERGSFFRWDFLGGQSKKYSPFLDVKKQRKFFPITAIACASHSADIVAVGYQEGVILIYDLAASGIVHKLRGHDEEIQSLHWRPPIEDEPPFLASGAKDAHVRIWDVYRGMEEASMRLPTFSKRGDGDQRNNQTWTSVAWIPGKKNELISGGYHGELLHWTLSDPDSTDGVKPKHKLINGRGVGHNRMIFNICLGGTAKAEEKPGLGLYGVTSSQDRNMVVWDLDDMYIRSSMFTCGGFVYALDVSPMDPTLIAVGCGDQYIRVWHRSPGNPTSTFWSGIRAMVCCLNWHPDREGFLAYGTNEGRVGSFDITKLGKAPIISTTYHKRTVYVVKWGPKCVAKGEELGNPDFKSVFSVGDGVVLQHNLFSKEKAVNLNDLIAKSNSTTGRAPDRTAMAWNLNFSLLAIGNEDGSTGIYSHPHLKQLVQLNGHVKLINCLAWKRPSDEEKRECGEEPSKNADYVAGGTALATGGGDNKVCVFYLRDTFDNDVEQSAVPNLYPKKAFGQHKGRITAIVWSPHEEWLLASASYDGSVQIWKLDNDQVKFMIANFRDHIGRTLTVVWDGSDPNILHSGADDFYLFSWDMTKQTHTEPPDENRFEKRFLENKKKAKDLRRKTKETKEIKESGPFSPPSSAPSLANAVKRSPGPEPVSNILNGIHESCNFSEGAGESPLVDDEIKELLHSKEEELLLKSLGESSPVTSSVSLTQIVDSTDAVSIKSSNTQLTGGKKPKIFRHTLGAFNNLSLETQIESFMALSLHAKHNLGGEKQNGIVKFKESKPAKDLVDQYSDIGFFTDRDAAMHLIDKEKNLVGSGEVDDITAEHSFQLEFMRGNVSKAVDDAILTKKLTDWMVSMTMMSSPYLRQKACIAYAEQLIHPSSNESPDPKKASFYLLACNMVYEAIQVLEEFKLFREAICIAKVRLRKEDPMVHRLLVNWARFQCRNGQTMHGAHCFVAAGEFQEAAAELRKRKGVHYPRVAEYVGMIGMEKSQNGILKFATDYISRCLMNNDWKEALTFCFSFDNLQEYVPNVLTHRLLTMAARDSLCLGMEEIAAFPDLIESIKDQTFYDADFDAAAVEAAHALELEGEEWLVTLHTQIQCLLPSFNLQNARFLEHSFSEGSKSEFLFNVSDNLMKAAVLALRYQSLKTDAETVVDDISLADIVKPLCENMASCAKRGEFTLVWKIHQSFFPYGLEEFIPDLHASSAIDLEAKNQFFKLAAIFDLYGNWWQSVDSSADAKENVERVEGNEVEEESEAMSAEDMQCWLDILLPVEPSVDEIPGAFNHMYPSREESVSVLLGYVLSDTQQTKENCDMLLKRIDSLVDKPELRAWARNRKEALKKRVDSE